MKKEKVFVFIDSQNLNLGTSKDIYNKKHKLVYKGWKLDYKKFYKYLSDKLRVKKVFLFIGYIKENENLTEFLLQHYLVNLKIIKYLFKEKRIS